MTEKQSKYIQAYIKRKYKMVSVCLSLEKDKDIIEELERVSPGNLQKGVKMLIRSAIEADKVLDQF